MTYCLVAFAVLLLLGAGLGLFFLQRQRRAQPPQPALSIPQVLPTGATLPYLEHRFQQAVASDLLGRRLARLYAVLLDQDLIQAYIKDAYLKPQITARTIENNTALFRCAAEIEEALEGRVFKGNPANTLASHLRSEFRKRGWAWPKHPYAWKQYFIQHHASILFTPEE